MELAKKPPVGLENALLIGCGGGFGGEGAVGGEERSTRISVCGGEDSLRVCVGCVIYVRGGDDGRAVTALLPLIGKSE